VIQLNAKQAAAIEAVKMVMDGQVVGLGSGSTAELFIHELGKRIQTEGLDVVGVPTSERSRIVGGEAGIPISTLEEHDHIDLTVDGADEVDPNLDLIKGLGGALLREKIIAAATQKEVIVIDETKLVHQLGTKSPLPVEIVQFSHGHISRELSKLRCTPTLRQRGAEPYVTDNGNYILDCSFKGIENPDKLDAVLHSTPGVVETGLFLEMADTVIIGSSTGVRIMKRKERPAKKSLR
jgi:ribose 5-phosphate isomerase A